MAPYPSVSDDYLETLMTNYIGFASFAALIWDHIDTFADEVEYVWKGKKGLFVYLFLFNRYFTPLGFIINLHDVSIIPYQKPITGTFIRCARFVKYEGCTVALAVEVVGFMMLLRIRALYTNSMPLTIFLALILIIETGVNAWLIAHAGPVIHNPQSGIRACSMVFDTEEPYSSTLASSSAWIPLLYDTVIFVLTLYRTVPPLIRAEASYILQRLFEDGLLYYSVIFSVTLVLTVMIIGAPQGIKNIAAQLEQLITVAMMSRITLNLRKAGKTRYTQTFHHETTNTDSTYPRPRRRCLWLLTLFTRSATEQGFELDTITYYDNRSRPGDANDIYKGIHRERRFQSIQFAVPDFEPAPPTTPGPSHHQNQLHIC